jgi:hypothetical protein
MPRGITASSPASTHRSIEEAVEFINSKIEKQTAVIERHTDKAKHYRQIIDTDVTSDSCSSCCRKIDLLLPNMMQLCSYLSDTADKDVVLFPILFFLFFIFFELYVIHTM